MMNIFDMLATNKDLEVQGIDYNMREGGTFVLARAGGANTNYAKALEFKLRPHRRQADRQLKPDAPVDVEFNALVSDLLRDAFCETVLLGWSGVHGRDGKSLKWSVEAAKKLMTEIPELYKELGLVAGEYSNYQDAVVEDDVKN